MLSPAKTSTCQNTSHMYSFWFAGIIWIVDQWLDNIKSVTEIMDWWLDNVKWVTEIVDRWLGNLISATEIRDRRFPKCKSRSRDTGLHRSMTSECAGLVALLLGPGQDTMISKRGTTNVKVFVLGRWKTICKISVMPQNSVFVWLNRPTSPTNCNSNMI